MIEMEDEFLSEEDLDLRNMTWEELVAYWNLWLLQAQATNDTDPPYTHGVLVGMTWDDVPQAKEPGDQPWPRSRQNPRRRRPPRRT